MPPPLPKKKGPFTLDGEILFHGNSAKGSARVYHALVMICYVSVLVEIFAAIETARRCLEIQSYTSI